VESSALLDRSNPSTHSLENGLHSPEQLPFSPNRRPRHSLRSSYLARTGRFCPPRSVGPLFGNSQIRLPPFLGSPRWMGRSPLTIPLSPHRPRSRPRSPVSSPRTFRRLRRTNPAQHNRDLADRWRCRAHPLRLSSPFRPPLRTRRTSLPSSPGRPSPNL